MTGEGRIGAPRCPRCLGLLEQSEKRGATCADCGRAFEPGPYHGTLTVGSPQATFAQRLDAEIRDRLVPALDRLDAPAATEEIIAAHAERAGIVIGNPVLEGRADLLRLMIEPRSVVLDLGCGFGTNTVALARDAAHVFALDRSPERVALTAARARAEGLDNVTAIHASGLDLPLGDGICAAVAIIGVLEWTGVGCSDPIAAQERVLAEAARVLGEGGLLVVGIENRTSGAYFAGMPEEHTGLRFISLLPRPLAGAVHRRARGAPYAVLTHGRRRLERMLLKAGLTPRVGFTAPSYQHPALSFDRGAAAEAKRFYIEHVFHPISTRRRIAGRLIAGCPTPLLLAVFPSFWAVGRKGGSAPEIPTVVLGSAGRDQAMKVLDWGSETLRAFDRPTRRLVRQEALVAGPNARRWIAWPFRRRSREARSETLLDELRGALLARAQGPASPALRDHCLRQAEAVLQRLDVEPEQSAALRGELAAIGGSREWIEHGDLTLGNVIVAARGAVLVDEPARAGHGLAGRDATAVALDVLSVEAGTRQLDLGAALERLPQTRIAIAPFLQATLETSDAEEAARRMVLAVLRHASERESWPGIRQFLAQAASGELAERLAAAGFAGGGGKRAGPCGPAFES